MPYDKGLVARIAGALDQPLLDQFRDLPTGRRGIDVGQRGQPIEPSIRCVLDPGHQGESGALDVDARPPVDRLGHAGVREAAREPDESGIDEIDRLGASR